MDREDARFIAHALESRISGRRVELEQLAASSLMRLSAIATRIDKRNDGNWVPAQVATEEIMTICRQGAKVADVAIDEHRKHELERFIQKMWDLAGEPPQAIPVNRRARRGQAKLLLPRSKRLIKAGTAELSDLAIGAKR